jgi:hypothetical protein
LKHEAGRHERLKLARLACLRFARRRAAKHLPINSIGIFIIAFLTVNRSYPNVSRSYPDVVNAHPETICALAFVIRTHAEAGKSVKLRRNLVDLWCKLVELR